jgi:multisubunit Na+/H+ antiporter MnhE subunit
MKYLNIVFLICLLDLGYIVAKVSFMWAKISFGLIFALVVLAYFLLLNDKKRKLKIHHKNFNKF